MKRIWIIILMLMSCSSLQAMADDYFTFTTNNTTMDSRTLDIKSTRPDWEYCEAGIKIDTPGYTLSGIECQYISNGYCIFNVSDLNAANIVINGYHGNVDFTLCLDGKNQKNCQHYSSNVPLLYVTNYYPFNTNCTTTNCNTLACPVNSDDTLGECFDSKGSNYFAENAITLNKDKTRAYIANARNNNCSISPTPQVSVCNVNLSGELSDCKDADFPGNPNQFCNGNNPTFQLSRYLGFNADETQAYVSNTFTNNLGLCNVSASGKLTDCKLAGGLAFPNNGAGLRGNFAFSPDRQFIYLACYKNSADCNTIYSCAIKNDGTLDTCTKALGSINFDFYNPNGLALNQAGDKIYITNYNEQSFQNPDPNITLCDVSGPSLSNCVKLHSNNPSLPFENPAGFTFNNAETLAYISDAGQEKVIKCPINLDGTFGTCVDAGNSGQAFFQPSLMWLIE